jgi:salicylate hydroxylase
MPKAWFKEMCMSSVRIAIAGGGIGGLAAAIALSRAEFKPTVFEQASQFSRVGSDINLTPNAVNCLDPLGLGDELRKWAGQPTFRLSRTWDTGEITSRMEMSDAAQRRFGAPQLTLHRADLQRVLENHFDAGRVQLGKRLTEIEQGNDIRLRFADGSSFECDMLIGADGIHSTVRKYLFGADRPKFTGMVCFRAVVPIESLDGVPNVETISKWWGPDKHSQVVHFPISAGREVFIFATAAQDDWRDEAWTVPGDPDELRSIYAAFHPDARALLDRCTSVVKQAIYDRDPLPTWSNGRITLMGDASHPMLPLMAQGSAMAIEDAVILSRLLRGASKDDIPDLFKKFETARKSRTDRVQIGSRANDWLRSGDDADWLFGYNAWNAPLQ